MGTAAAIAWWIARQAAGNAASYAPITAIVALGLGRERRLGRSALLTSGLLLGVVAAEVATAVLGVGWWQVGLCMTAAAVVAGALIGRDLAVTYAAINAVVLLTTPGSGGWFPSRVVAGLVGVATALTVMLLVAPARPVDLVRRRLGRATERADDALTAAADALADGLDEREPDGDEGRLVDLARRLDDEIEQSHATVAQARELVRWSPWRRSDADEIGRLDAMARGLRPELRTASTIARLADRAVALGVDAPEPITTAMRRAGSTLRSFTRHLVDDTPPDTDDVTATSDLVDRLMEAEVEHATLVALKEEVRGLLSDLDHVVDHLFDDAPEVPDHVRAATVGHIEYGR